MLLLCPNSDKKKTSRGSRKSKFLAFFLLDVNVLWKLEETTRLPHCGNGLRVLCCSDTAADRAAAALDVHVGRNLRSHILKVIMAKNGSTLFKGEEKGFDKSLLYHAWSALLETGLCLGMHQIFGNWQRALRLPVIQWWYPQLPRRHRSGYFSDPEDLPGLAHFCEHMLFLGTEPFPEENSCLAMLRCRKCWLPKESVLV